MDVHTLCVEGAFVIEGIDFVDDRGNFRELFHSGKRWKDLRLTQMQQINVSSSKKDVLRGLHTSKYYKLISILSGEVYDVIVDLRECSPTFLKWSATVLSAENKKQVLVPGGCAHGFLCLNEATIIYSQGGTFDTSQEQDVCPFDPTLNIFWPRPKSGRYVMSEKDRCAPCLSILNFRVPKNPLGRNLIIGASGQVGGALVESLGISHCIGTYEREHALPRPGFVKVSLECLLKDPKACSELISSVRPHVIYICAAYTWVDGCEIDEEKAFNVNCFAPGRIAEEAQKVGSKIVYFSSDYIFDGTNGPNRESCLPNPINIYGRSKYEGEKLVLSACAEALILRTTIVYGPEEQGKNFIYQLVDSLQKEEEFLCAKDQIGTPTYNRDLVRMTLGLVEANAKGVYNCAGKEIFDRYSFACKCATLLGYDQNLIKDVTTSEAVRQGKAKRGLKLGLNMDKTLTFLEKKYHPNTLQKNLEDWLDRQRGTHIQTGFQSQLKKI